MTATENLKKHIEDLEEKRLSAFFHMQHVAAEINGRLYNYNTTIGLGSLALLLFASLVKESDTFLLAWSKFFALSAITISLIEYLYTIDKNSTKLYKSIRMIYGSYDDEYVVLKKFDSGEINEGLIRQYYSDKSKKLDRYSYNISLPGWLTWVTTSLMIASATLLALA